MGHPVQPDGFGASSKLELLVFMAMDMDLDEAFTVVGEMGIYQVYLCFLLVFVLRVLTACHACLIAVVGITPQFRWDLAGQLNDSLDDARAFQNWLHESNETEIHRHLHFNDSRTSVVSEWYLLGDAAYKVSLLSSLYFTGLLLSGLIFGLFSDRYGRRRAYLTGLTLALVMGVASGIAPSYPLFAVTRFLVGVAFGGAALVAAVWINELVGRPYWALMSIVMNISFVVGIMLFGLLGYVVLPWRPLALGLNLLLGLLLVLCLFVPESPHWLLSQGQLVEAKRVLLLIGQRNGRRVLNGGLSLSSSEKRGGGARAGLLELVRCRARLSCTLIMMYNWVVSSLSYYGVTLNVENLGGNLCLNLALSGLAELTSIPLCLYLIGREWCGRRGSMCLFLLVAGIASFIISFLLPRQDSWRLLVVTSLVAKAAIRSAFALVFIYTSELYPTFLRSTGMGVCNMASKGGALLAPFIPSLAGFALSLPYVVLGVMAVSAGMLSLLLPETLNQTLPNSLSDLSVSFRGVAYHRLRGGAVNLLEGGSVSEALEGQLEGDERNDDDEDDFGKGLSAFWKKS